MKLKIKNLGVLTEAELALGDVTILTGENNTGKTYSAYALWALLNCFQDYPNNTPFPMAVRRLHSRDLSDVINEADAKGEAVVELKTVIDLAQSNAKAMASIFSETLAKVFGAAEKVFEGANLQLDIGELSVPRDAELNLQVGHYILVRERGSPLLRLTKTVIHSTPPDDDEARERPSLAHPLTQAVIGWVYAHAIPATVIITSERSGITLFQNELDFQKNALADQMKNLGKKKFNPFDFMRSVSRYAEPIQDNIDRARDFSNLMKRTSFFATAHKNVLDQFAQLAGGAYKVGVSGDLHYIPAANVRGKKAKSLPVYLASSSARALSFLSLYVHHSAQKGDLLVIDEPELNLHPSKQRLLARLVALMANAGVRVLLTTHSDHIVREFHHLIQLSGKLHNRAKFLKQIGYQEDEVLKPGQVKLYVAEAAAKGGTLSLVEATTDGFARTTFDEVLNAMNSVSDAILFNKEAIEDE